jgi:hypothetical protein
MGISSNAAKTAHSVEVPAMRVPLLLNQQSLLVTRFGGARRTCSH